LIYDTVLNITWAQPSNVNEASRSVFYNSYLLGLTLGGATGWRVPYGIADILDVSGPGISVVDCSSEPTCRGNELAYMFYYNLGGTAGQSILTSSDPDLGLFPSLQPRVYWTGLGYLPGDLYTYAVNFGTGTNDLIYSGDYAYIWAVHDGNAGATVVPIPPALWLFGTGLLGLLGISSRKKAA